MRLRGSSSAGLKSLDAQRGMSSSRHVPPPKTTTSRRQTSTALLGKDLVYIDVDAERRFVTYSVSAQAVDDMDLLCDKDCRAEAAADAIVEHLTVADGMFDDDENEDYDEDNKP